MNLHNLESTKSKNRLAKTLSKYLVTLLKKLSTCKKNQSGKVPS